MKGRPFAAFDIDGTVLRWQLYHALADELARRGHIDPAKFRKVRAVRMTWKRRNHENSFHEYERALISLVEEALAGLPLEEFEAACLTVMEEYRDQVYTYTRDLIGELKAQGYILFVISASQSQIVRLFAQYYGFDDYAGSEYQVKDGRFTGRMHMLLKQERKPALLKELADKHQAVWEGSIAVGDSESDIHMLEAVEMPIAFNPTKALFHHAQKQGWRVVVERKNMIYSLEPRRGTYVLAQPEA